MPSYRSHAGRGEAFAGRRLAHNAAAPRPAAEERRADGPGDGQDGPRPGVAVPTGEDGLLVLADYAPAHGGSGVNANDNSDNVPAFPEGIGSQQGGPYGGPGSAGSTGGGPSGGGLGGGGGGPGAGTPQHGGPADPNGNIGSDGGNGDGGHDGGGQDGGKVCVVSTFDTCGQTTSDSGSKPHETVTPAALVVPVDGGPGGDTLPSGPVPEPSAWLMMILGFGGAGVVLRARRGQGRHALA